ncbi:MAG: hypothetical protein ABR551_14005, partial [Gemmatimonadales bacterium]
APHIHRWVSPVGDLLDLVPAGSHAGGSGHLGDAISMAMATAVDCDLGDGVRIRHASSVAFLALKWVAFLDRGAADPRASHDLEDMLALLAARPQVVAEVATAPTELMGCVSRAARDLIAMPELDDLLAGHLNNAYDAAQVCDQVRQRLRALARAEGQPT